MLPDPGYQANEPFLTQGFLETRLSSESLEPFGRWCHDWWGFNVFYRSTRMTLLWPIPIYRPFMDWYW